MGGATNFAVQPTGLASQTGLINHATVCNE